MKKFLLLSNARRLITPKSKVRIDHIDLFLDLEDNVRHLRQVNEDQKRTIDQLETQKIEQKLEFDTQLFNM